MKLALLAAFLALPLAAQPAFPDLAIGGGLQYSQQSQPQSQGLAFVAKLADKTHGIYNYNLLRITAVTFDKKTHAIGVQKQAETGVAIYINSFNLGPSLGTWDCFTAVTGGAALVGGSVGASASGTPFCARPLGKGWYLDVFGGVSYSALANGGGSAGVSYPAGLAFHWGGKL